MVMVAMITVPASEIYMNENVPLTITITDALSPCSNHSAFYGTFCLSLADKQLCLQPCMGTSEVARAPLARSLWRV